ncbi:DUF4172 domain-containing protein [Pseudoroseomonas wenyumeiae]|uniref:DUF4172 domain-containing protein n=1 Tax=Teichococcus wenyumeiae TaxID=2478470 RepID=A0A3A9JNS0_9PROT|nr:Fic family protein [Pseudoroseomonas wenyumeiae]RKK06175.1 Fic family protein [Pseudoroseomonas wenyumeiae]RMI17516.1 DUF4172 domain-containing protein [Pseudoroseomonas wenyumeiae]
MYIWQHSAWPEFRWNAEALLPLVAEARFRQGRFLGTMAAAGLETRQEAELSASTEDVVATSAIEGERLPPASVRSSVARRLGLPQGGVLPQDSQVEGIAEVVLDATRHFQAPLTEERIFAWHRALFAAPGKGPDPIDIGRWRTDAHGRMQVVSGVYRGGKPPRVHYEAPPAAVAGREMRRFLAWFNGDGVPPDGLVRAGLAHLWFVTIHPLDDGNGRVGRAIADMAIAQAEGTGQRFYSLSSAILRQRKGYYDALEQAQKGDLDVTEWLGWFLRCHRQAIAEAEETARRVVGKARFWAALDAGPRPVNERQRKVLAKLIEDWEGPMTTRKWVAICGCSADTAQRDIADLLQRGLLRANEKGGRSIGYDFTGP